MSLEVIYWGDFMSMTVTHSFFANDIYDILPRTISQKVDLRRLRMFAQGVDGFDYYRNCLFFKNKKMKAFYQTFHTTKTKDYFIHLLEYMKKHKIKDKDTYSYLVGMISHYALEVTINPYIIYKTGIFKKGNVNSYPYNNLYLFMEHFLDNDMIQRRKKMNPYRFSIKRFCFERGPFSSDLKRVLSYSFQKTYGLTHMDRKYLRSLRKMRRRIQWLQKDSLGIKKFFYTLIDTFTPRKSYRFEPLSYHYSLKDTHHYLNQDHKLWRNPTTYDMTSTDSYVDLYLKAIKLAKRLVSGSFDYLSGKNVSLEKLFKNYNYFTGISCRSKKELKYFEF